MPYVGNLISMFLEDILDNSKDLKKYKGLMQIIKFGKLWILSSIEEFKVRT